MNSTLGRVLSRSVSFCNRLIFLKRSLFKALLRWQRHSFAFMVVILFLIFLVHFSLLYILQTLSIAQTLPRASGENSFYSLARGQVWSLQAMASHSEAGNLSPITGLWTDNHIRTHYGEIIHDFANHGLKHYVVVYVPHCRIVDHLVIGMNFPQCSSPSSI